jgi:hypothetical protein
LLNRYIKKLIDHMSKGFLLMWVVLFITGCTGSLATLADSSSQPDTTAINTQTPTVTPGVIENTPLLAKSPVPDMSFVLGDCQQSTSLARPAGASHTSEGGSKPALPSDPVLGLQQALQLVNQEMHAAAQSTSLEDAKSHAEAVVNILDGYWGCWYGDADGNGLVNDPSNGYGVLPAGRVQSAAPDTRAAQVQIGWALNVYENSNSNAKKQVQIILGDVKQWQNNPMSTYEYIQTVVQNSEMDHLQVGKLNGQAIQAVAWARLILVKAQTTDQAHEFADKGLQNTAKALQAALQIG